MNSAYTPLSPSQLDGLSEMGHPPLHSTPLHNSPDPSAGPGPGHDILEAAEEHVRNITRTRSPSSTGSLSTISDREGEEAHEGGGGEEDESRSPLHGRAWSDLESGPYKGGQTQKRRDSWLCLVLGIILLMVWVIFVASLVMYEAESVKPASKGAADISGQAGGNTTGTIPPVDFDSIPEKQPGHDGEKRRYTLDDVMYGTLRAESASVRWVRVESGEDGLYTEVRDGAIWVASMDAEAPGARKLAELSELVDERGSRIPHGEYTLSPDLLYIMLSSPGAQVWRHSSMKEYFIYDVVGKKARRLTRSGPAGRTRYATWSPTGHSVAFVRDNDVYTNVDLKGEERITFDGSEMVFNGIPDWIYEEEVYEADFTLWWSPDSRALAYLRLDETAVPVYTYDMYESPGLPHSSYPTKRNIKYPKAGYPNPLATVYVHRVGDPIGEGGVPAVSFGGHDFVEADRLIVEVAWVGAGAVFVRTMNRSQDVARLHLVDVKTLAAPLVREERGDVDGGWVDIRKGIRYIPPIAGRRPAGYIDMVTTQGYNHLAYFSTLNASVPAVHLTPGEWEVTEPGVAGLGRAEERVWYVSTERGSTERHLYSVGLDGSGKMAHTPADGGVYGASMSPGAGWYVLTYRGPDVPTARVVRADGKGEDKVLEENTYLRGQMKEFNLPSRRFGTIVTEDGVEMNYMEMLPPGFDPSGKEKYGVLMNIYAGPKSQTAGKDFGFDFHHAIASEEGLRMIVLKVDARGTGFKGRAFRSLVRKRLGHYETIDHVAAAKHWAALPYVDAKRIAIWGWSYGGYATAKAVEANAGVFAAAVSVAPVTDWRFYDTVYTERYMLTPKENPEGYEEAAVRHAAGFRNTKYLLCHGLSDDNVHFQQTAHLVDMLTAAKIRDYQVQFYTDNEHSLGYNGARGEMYARFRRFLHQSMPVTGSQK